MDFQIEGTKPLIWIDPRTKFALLFFIGIFSLCVPAPPLMIEAAVFTVLLLLLLANRMVSFVVKTGCVCCLLLMLQFLLKPVITGGFIMFLLSLARLLRMFFPIYLAAILLIRTTTVSEFLAAFRRLHLPDAFIIPLSVMFRFIPTISEEWHSIRNAMRFRGISLSVKNFCTKPMFMLEYMLVPLLMSTATIAEELAAASLSRGLDSGVKRTSLNQVRPGLWDGLLLLALLTLAILWGKGMI